MSSPINWWQGSLLGLVQGLTEFIPVSSSAHLNILHSVFGQDRKLAYDVLLSLGTTIALAAYFQRDWKELLTNPKQAQLRNMVLIGCVPAVILGVIIHKFEDHPPLKEPWFNAVLLVVAGLILLAADYLGRKVRPLEDVKLNDSLLVGLGQALALFPGVSRSGATITVGLMRGMSRDAAARFSFLMSLPISIGALLYEGYKDVYKAGGLQVLDATVPAMLLGVAISALSGFLAISFLLNYLRQHGMLPFVVWRVFVAILVWTFLKPEPKPPVRTGAPRAAQSSHPLRTRRAALPSVLLAKPLLQRGRTLLFARRPDR